MVVLLSIRLQRRVVEVIKGEGAVGGAAPIGGVYPCFNPAGESRCLPVLRTKDVPMFDRIIMHVVEVTLEIVFLVNGMLPIARLPHTAVAPARPSGQRRSGLCPGTQPRWLRGRGRDVDQCSFPEIEAAGEVGCEFQAVGDANQNCLLFAGQIEQQLAH